VARPSLRLPAPPGQEDAGGECSKAILALVQTPEHWTAENQVRAALDAALKVKGPRSEVRKEENATYPEENQPEKEGEYVNKLQEMKRIATCKREIQQTSCIWKLFLSADLTFFDG